MEETRLARLYQERPEHIVHLYHTIKEGTLTCMLTSYEEGCELWDMLMLLPTADEEADDHIKHRCVGLTRSLAQYYLSQIVAGVAWLHERGIAHRDLKPENMIVSSATSRLRLIDFGTIKDMIHTELNGPDFVGTAEYMSPEAINNGKGEFGEVGLKTDMWSLGVVLYQMLVGSTPFKGGSDYLTMQRAIRGPEQLILGGYSQLHLEESEKELLSALCCMNPSERPSAEELKAHRFFGELDWSATPTRPPPEPSCAELLAEEVVAKIRAGEGAAAELGDVHVRALL